MKYLDEKFCKCCGTKIKLSFGQTRGYYKNDHCDSCIKEGNHLRKKISETEMAGADIILVDENGTILGVRQAI